MRFSYIQDRFVPMEDATVSIEERGFRFADGVFETIPVYDAVPYQWQFHLERLQRGLAAIKITYDISALPKICKQLLHKNHCKDCVLRIYISRGIGSRGYLPISTPNNTGPLLVIETLEKRNEINEAISLWLSNYEKISPRALPVEHKVAQGLNAALARMEAVERGCFEALQLGALGQICEASSANIFWFRDGTLYTPSLASGCLAGSIRDVVIRLSPYPLQQSAYMLEDLVEASAVFLTNSSYLAVPVARLVPQGVTWESEMLTLEIKTLIKYDIATYLKQHGF